MFTELGGTKTGRVDSSVRGDVVDLTARDADVHKLAVRQATQLGSQPLAFAPLTKCIPICFEGAVIPAALRLPVRTQWSRGSCSLRCVQVGLFHQGEVASTIRWRA